MNLYRGLTLLAVLLVILVTNYYAPGRALDRVTFDLASKLWPESLWNKAVTSEPNLILIDDRSLAELGRWPWGRDIHAKMIEMLTDAGSSVVAYNVAFIEPDITYPANDERLKQAFADHQHVVLPVISSYYGQELFTFHSPYLDGVSFGHVHLALEEDGIFRQLFLKAGMGKPKWPIYALAAYREAKKASYSASINKTPTATSNGGLAPLGDDSIPGRRSPYNYVDFQNLWSSDYAVRSSFHQNFNQIPKFSFIEVLNGRVPLEQFNNKAVFVGMSASGFEQKFPVNSNNGIAYLSGTEIQSLLYRELQLNTLLTPSGKLVNLYLALIYNLLLFLLLATLSLSRRARFILSFSMFFALTLIPITAIYTGFWVSIAAALAGVLTLLLSDGFWYIKQMDSDARRDLLTGLANRRMFNETSAEEWNTAIRQSKPISLLLVDVDYFKQFNDTQGHAHGDWALARLAKTFIKYSRRTRDLAARYGGEEFAIILPMTEAEQALELARTLCEDVESQQIAHSASLVSTFLTVSIGVTTIYPSKADDISRLLKQADLALYQAKAEGRNRVEVFTPLLEIN